MITVKLFGTLRMEAMMGELHFQQETDEKEPNSDHVWTLSRLLEEVMIQIRQKNAETKIDRKRLKDCLIYVNGVNMMDLRKLKTPLKDGDQVMFLAPAGGG